MSDVEHHIRCQRCGAEMELRDPGPGRPWTPDQFWVCPKCGRHFWSTYPSATVKPAAAPAPANAPAAPVAAPPVAPPAASPVAKPADAS